MIDQWIDWLILEPSAAAVNSVEEEEGEIKAKSTLSHDHVTCTRRCVAPLVWILVIWRAYIYLSAPVQSLPEAIEEFSR